MDKEEAREYLSTLINKYLRILTTDGRMFRGTFKCTDPVRPTILSYDYIFLLSPIKLLYSRIFLTLNTRIQTSF